MKKLLLASLALAAMSLPAAAADMRMPVKAPVVVAPVPTWAGFYIGVNAGYAWTNDVDTTASANANTLAPGQFPVSGPPMVALLVGTLSADGFTGGIQAGYNWQVGSIVFGAEADLNYMDLHDRFAGAVAGTLTTGFVDVKSQYLATFRGRLGFAFDRFMIYGTAGVAVADFDRSFGSQICASPVNCAFWAASSSSNDVEFIYGGGAEFMFASNWTAKVEYLHADFGSQSLTGVGTGPLINQAPACVNCTVTVNTSSLKLDIVRAGVNYKF